MARYLARCTSPATASSEERDLVSVHAAWQDAIAEVAVAYERARRHAGGELWLEETENTALLAAVGEALRAGDTKCAEAAILAWRAAWLQFIDNANPGARMS